MGWILAAAPAVGVAVFLVVQIGWNRATQGAQLLRGFLIGFAVGGLVAAAMTIVAVQALRTPIGDRFAVVAFNAAYYIVLAYCYVNFVNIQIASIRLRIMDELLRTPDGVDQRALLDRYQPRDIVAARLERLVSGEQLTLRDGRYYTRPCTSLTIARIFQGLRRLLLGSDYRLDADADLNA